MAFPALFVSHAAPTVAIEEDAYTRALAAWARDRPTPRAIVVMSAHWEAQGPIRVNVGARPALMYDFFGFPPRLYQLAYDAPGAPALAGEVLEALAGAGLDPAAEESRSWDHGVWVPLRLLFPEANVPVLAVSLPVPRDPALLLRAGEALAPLRKRGVLVFGSGGVVHNLHRLDRPKGAPAAEWAAAFDAWVAGRLGAMDVEAIADYIGRAPHADQAAPTTEHFDPLFFVLGSRSERDRVVPVFEGFHHGSLSLRSFALAEP
ncbi:MAG TPA: class III extradiol ring-cleavage dioxygenase [Vicinamibacteria bacterium]|nr:class III extradiol ring-cleavage dioxygenase [Vicinamibacteria bacterium]